MYKNYTQRIRECEICMYSPIACACSHVNWSETNSYVSFSKDEGVWHVEQITATRRVGVDIWYLATWYLTGLLLWDASWENGCTDTPFKKYMPLTISTSMWVAIGWYCTCVFVLPYFSSWLSWFPTSPMLTQWVCRVFVTHKAYLYLRFINHDHNHTCQPSQILRDYPGLLISVPDPEKLAKSRIFVALTRCVYSA